MGLKQVLNRLNGWQRLWLVLMALGLLAIYPIAFSAAQGNTLDFESDVYQAFSLPECEVVLQMPAGSKLASEPSYNSPCSSLYIYRSVFKDAAASAEGYMTHIRLEQREYVQEFAKWLLLAWAVLGALVYASGAIVGWIDRGFRRQPG